MLRPTLLQNSWPRCHCSITHSLLCSSCLWVREKRFINQTYYYYCYYCAPCSPTLADRAPPLSRVASRPHHVPHDVRLFITITVPSITNTQSAIVSKYFFYLEKLGSVVKKPNKEAAAHELLKRHLFFSSCFSFLPFTLEADAGWRRRTATAANSLTKSISTLFTRVSLRKSNRLVGRRHFGWF